MNIDDDGDEEVEVVACGKFILGGETEAVKEANFIVISDQDEDTISDNEINVTDPPIGNINNDDSVSSFEAKQQRLLREQSKRDIESPMEKMERRDHEKERQRLNSIMRSVRKKGGLSKYSNASAISLEEYAFFSKAYPDVTTVRFRRVHCTSCRRHIGTAPCNGDLIMMHPILRVTICRKCFDFYNSGEFSKGPDGSEFHCRWCGQGGEVFCCTTCPYVFCKTCITKNLSRDIASDIEKNSRWSCFSCQPLELLLLRAQHWALVNFILTQKQYISSSHLTREEIDCLMNLDRTKCCRRYNIGKKIINLNDDNNKTSTIETSSILLPNRESHQQLTANAMPPPINNTKTYMDVFKASTSFNNVRRGDVLNSKNQINNKNPPPRRFSMIQPKLSMPQPANQPASPYSNGLGAQILQINPNTNQKSDISSSLRRMTFNQPNILNLHNRNPNSSNNLDASSSRQETPTIIQSHFINSHKSRRQSSMPFDTSKSSTFSLEQMPNVANGLSNNSGQHDSIRQTNLSTPLDRAQITNSLSDTHLIPRIQLTQPIIPNSHSQRNAVCSTSQFASNNSSTVQFFQFQSDIVKAMENCCSLVNNIQTIRNNIIENVESNKLKKELYVPLSHLLTYANESMNDLKMKCSNDMRNFEGVSERLLNTEIPTNQITQEATTENDSSMFNSVNGQYDMTSYIMAGLLEVELTESDQSLKNSSSPQSTTRNLEQSNKNKNSPKSDNKNKKVPVRIDCSAKRWENDAKLKMKCLVHLERIPQSILEKSENSNSNSSLISKQKKQSIINPIRKKVSKSPQKQPAKQLKRLENKTVNKDPKLKMDCIIQLPKVRSLLAKKRKENEDKNEAQVFIEVNNRRTRQSNGLESVPMNCSFLRSGRNKIVRIKSELIEECSPPKLKIKEEI